MYIRKVQLEVLVLKNELSLDWIIRLSPNLKLCDINRMEYQKILNDYAVFY
nr:hypothetical protein [Mycoplasmopsis cynos]